MLLKIFPLYNRRSIKRIKKIRGENMKIGYACISLLSGYNSAKRFNLSGLSEKRLYEYIEKNLEGLQNILEYNKMKEIMIFRITSDLIPFLSHEKNIFEWKKKFAYKLISIGKYANDNNMRLTMHPGQYTVINSMDKEVVRKSIRDIEEHTEIMDLLGLDSSHKITVHIGGAYGDKEKSAQRFVENYKLLSKGAKERLIIENDDKIYNTDDLKIILSELDIPVVFDNLHNSCNPSQKEEYELLDEISGTWNKKDGSMLLHYSETENPKRCSHTFNISAEKFTKFVIDTEKYNPDIIIEAKGKDIAAVKGNKILKELQGSLRKRDIEEEWAAYKYAVMERGYNFYIDISKSLKTEKSIVSFYSRVEEILKKEKGEKATINTLDHIRGYFSTILSQRQKNHLDKLCSEKKYDNAKKYLHRMAFVNNIEYLKKSYYWYY